MKQFKYKKIDAFATKYSGGNPAGYIWIDENQNIDESDMLLIAKQQKGFVNEVGFISQKSDELFELKYYSSEREVDFCGHATIAIMYDLVKSNASISQKPQFYIQTNRGLLTVYNRVALEDAVFIESPEPRYFQKIPSIVSIALNLKIAVTTINNDLPITIINAGLNTLIVPIKSLDDILNIMPKEDDLKLFCEQNNIDIILVFTSEVASSKSDFRTRVFAPTFGYLEDPATGSGNAAFGYYLLKTDRWNIETVTIEQNNEKQRFNIIKLQKAIDKKGTTRVLFGGAAITRIEGNYFLQ